MPFFSIPKHSTAVKRRPCCAVALRRTAWSEHGWAWHGKCESDTAHCLNQMGKTHSKPLAAWHGRGTAWVRHVMCESALTGTSDFSSRSSGLVILYLPFLTWHRAVWQHLTDVLVCSFLQRVKECTACWIVRLLVVFSYWTNFPPRGSIVPFVVITKYLLWAPLLFYI